MACVFRRMYYKYTKCVVLTVLAAFFGQILLAVFFFPAENDNLLTKQMDINKFSELGSISARKFDFGITDDEDIITKKTKQQSFTNLRLQELDFKPLCEIKHKEAISAIHRAKTQICKQQIVNITCLIQDGNFYPKALPHNCLSSKNMTYGRQLGCFRDEKKLRILSSFYGNFLNSNSPQTCLDICVQAGFPFAGVQYGSECFCGENLPLASSKINEDMCDMNCTGDQSKICGGYFTMNVLETGLSKFTAVTPETVKNDSEEPARIIFLLTLNGRALRQVNRLINSLYRTKHYFYIHVDKRQDYLHRKLSALEKKFPNIKLATQRFASIWGGASLLEMLLTSMKEILTLKWQWDFIINLSESDFPIKSIENLQSFLSVNKGFNFVKSHGREVQRFIKKQGLDKTFIECETHMWRVGDRKLPKGLVVDGGSDWIALSPKFVSYVAGYKDELLKGLGFIFRHTLLPAESFFHTVLRNSKFCNTYVDNNLHVTNWKRKLGCKCQYKHVVDWCGCSPNDFRVDDWPRIQNTQERQLFFARKFEPIISQEIITRVEQFIGYDDHYLLNNLEGYWQNIYDIYDLTASTDDLFLTHAGSMIRHNSRILLGSQCVLNPTEIIEINSYNYEDVYKGNLILHKAILNDGNEILLETWYKPKQYTVFNFENPHGDNIKIFRVSSDYDQKEITFRNFANVLGPLSEPNLLYQFSPSINYTKGDNLTVVWLDPAGEIADVNIIQLEENNLTNFIKPQLKVPLLPGVWNVSLLDQLNIIVTTKFLIIPLEYFSGKETTSQEATIIHSGSQNSYKNFTNFKARNIILPSEEESLLLKKVAQANVKRIGQDLREWIDSLTLAFYSILGTCVSSINTKFSTDICGNHKFELCSSTMWSSLSPDPKGTIGKLNESTGRLDRHRL